MKKKNFAKFIIIFLIFVVLIGSGLAAYFLFSEKNVSRGRDTQSEIINPARDLSDEKALEQFDENFVLYLLASIGASRLHNPPLSSNTPKIEMFVSNDIYNAEINTGTISVRKSEIAKADIIIRTTKEEAIKMIRDKNYIAQSFREGESSIELVESKTTLLAKGYLKIYNELTGEKK